jgi:hypothetical protein
MADFSDFCVWPGLELLQCGNDIVLSALQAGRSIVAMTGNNPAGFALCFANRTCGRSDQDKIRSRR